MVLLNYPRTGSTWARGVLRRLHGVEHNALARPLAGTRVGWRGFHELMLPIDRTATARRAHVTLKSSALTHTPLILDYYWQQPQRSKRQHASAECCPVVGPAPPSARLGEHRPTQHAPPLWMCVPPRVASNRAFSGARSGRRHVHFVGPANAAVANRTPRVITLSVLTRSARVKDETENVL